MNEIERAYYASEIHIPNEIRKRQEASKAKTEEESQKRLFRHEWKLAIFNTVAGGVAGLLTSIIFWLITK